MPWIFECLYYCLLHWASISVCEIDSQAYRANLLSVETLVCQGKLVLIYDELHVVLRMIVVTVTYQEKKKEWYRVVDWLALYVKFMEYQYLLQGFSESRHFVK